MKDDFGNIINGDILTTYRVDWQNFIIYTTNEIEDGKLKLIVGKYVLQKGIYVVSPVHEEVELNYARKVIDSITKKD